MFGSFGEAVVRLGHKLAYKAKYHSPEMLAVAGTIAVVGGVVLCCKATLKVEEVLDKSIELKDEIEKALNNPEVEYTDKDAARDSIVLRCKTAGGLAKLYAPGAGLILLGIGCYMGSYGIMKKRNIALIGAYNALSDEFMRYREKIRGSENGLALDRQALHNESDISEGGDDKMCRMNSPFVKCFSADTTVEWTRNANANLAFLRQQERYCNDKLRANGHLFLNEVYDLLGLDRDEAGALCGWIYKPGEDHQVDFGINNRESIAFIPPQAFSAEPPSEFLLDFNAEGIIADKI